MSLRDDLKAINKSSNVLNKNNLGLSFFTQLATNKKYHYKPETLYRAYILSYIAKLWDNFFYICTNASIKHTKIKGLGTGLLDSKYLSSALYFDFVKLEDFLEANYFSRYSGVRYLTQAYTNYRFNKKEHYRFIPSYSLFSDKARQSYLALSKGLSDGSIKQDNLAFMSDPVTVALMNYYYDLDKPYDKHIYADFKTSLDSSYEKEAVSALIKPIELIKSKSVMMYTIANIGLTLQDFSFSYADNFLISYKVSNFADDQLCYFSDNYLVSGNYNEDAYPYNVTIALSRLFSLKDLLTVCANKRLGCSPIDDSGLDKLRGLGVELDKMNRINLSYLNYSKGLK